MWHFIGVFFPRWSPDERRKRTLLASREGGTPYAEGEDWQDDDVPEKEDED